MRRHPSVHLRFDADCVLGEVEGVDVEVEGNRRVAELPDAVERVKASRHADLDHVLAERADIRYDIYITGPHIRRPEVDVLDGVVDLLQLLTQSGGHRLVAFRERDSEGIDVMLALLLEPSLLALDLLLGQPLLT